MSKDKLNVKIKALGFLDLLAFKKLVPDRKKRIENADASRLNTAPVNILAASLHPVSQHLIVDKVTQQTDLTKTYRLIPDTDLNTLSLAYFRPGQYLTFIFNLEGSTVTRPYSISSSPKDALDGFYEITVKRDEKGYISNHIFNTWERGTKTVCSGPEGFFYHEPLRDRKNVIGLAGGCGITPFRSMARQIVEGKSDMNLTLIYGSNVASDIVFKKEFDEIEKQSNGKFKIVHVLCDEKLQACESGYITADIIKKHADVNNSSIFVCGPQAMYKFLEKEIAAFNLERKYVRFETFGEIKNVKDLSDYPAKKVKGKYNLKVHMGGKVSDITGNTNESVLVAMERAGLNPPSSCRSGTCGLCRSLLIKGDVFIPEDQDGRRKADIHFGYIHPCASFALNDLELVIPVSKVKA